MGMDPQATHSVAKTTGSWPQSDDSKAPLLKTTHTSLIQHGAVELVPT